MGEHLRGDAFAACGFGGVHAFDFALCVVHLAERHAAENFTALPSAPKRDGGFSQGINVQSMNAACRGERACELQMGLQQGRDFLAVEVVDDDLKRVSHLKKL